MTDKNSAGNSGEFLVRKDALHETKWFDLPDPAGLPLEKGQVLLAVDCFAMTANNITYAVFGNAMQYWNFFPAREGWGTVPVWGYATVARSKADGIDEGERIYGYLPMSTHFVATVTNVTPGGFTEVSPHRKDLPAIYNQYSRTKNDPSYDAKREAEAMLYRPLFMTGFLIDDFLADASFFGAKSVLVSSASSKTSIGLAFNLARRGREVVEVIGLTSKANKAFVEGLGCYHRVVAYDEIETLPATTPSVFVDMAGDTSVTSSVHRHFGGALKYSCSVGGTHWNNLAFGQEFPGPRPTLFFAPAQVARRLEDWGPNELQRRMGEAWLAFLPKADGWITVDRSAGRDAVQTIFKLTLDGVADPKHGYILSMA